MSKNVVGSMSDWFGMLKDLFRQINDGSIQLVQLQAFLEHRNPFKVDVSALLVDWQAFYKDAFGMDVDFSELRVPDYKQGFDRLIVVAKGMTPQLIFDKCKELFPCWKHTEAFLDKIVISERTASQRSYAVWVRDRQEADEKNKNLSANKLKEQGIQGITLEERLLYELRFFKETNDHLDKDSRTLCSGSRGSVGYVPRACWRDFKLRVYWRYPGGWDDGLRARSVVS